MTSLRFNCRRAVSNRLGAPAPWICAIALCAASGCAATNKRILEPIQKSTAAWELDRAERLAERGAETDAAAAFRRAIRNDPRCAAAHAGLARLLARRDDLEGAVEHYRAAVKGEPGRFDYAIELAHCLRAAGQRAHDPRPLLSDAIRAYQYAESLDRNHYVPPLYVGVCYRMLGDVDRALDHLRRSASLNPAAIEPHIEKAAAHHARSEFRSALAEYRLALEIDADNVQAHNGSGRIQALMARTRGTRGALARERAIAHFRRSLEVSPGQPEIRRAMSDLEMYQYPGVQIVRDEPADD